MLILQGLPLSVDPWGGVQLTVTLTLYFGFAGMSVSVLILGGLLTVTWTLHFGFAGIVCECVDSGGQSTVTWTLHFGFAGIVGGVDQQ